MPQTKIEGKFYPLQKDEFVKISTQLKDSELRVYLYLCCLLPFKDSKIEIDTEVISQDLGLTRRTIQRALKCLNEMRLMSIEMIKFQIKRRIERTTSSQSTSTVNESSSKVNRPQLIPHNLSPTVKKTQLIPNEDLLMVNEPPLEVDELPLEVNEMPLRENELLSQVNEEFSEDNELLPIKEDLSVEVDELTSVNNESLLEINESSSEINESLSTMNLATDGSPPATDGSPPATDGSPPATDGSPPATDGSPPKPKTFSETESQELPDYSEYLDIIKTLSDSERENFFSFGRRKARELPRPPVLTMKWIEKNFLELYQQFEKAMKHQKAAQEAQKVKRAKRKTDKKEGVGISNVLSKLKDEVQKHV